MLERAAAPPCDALAQSGSGSGSYSLASGDQLQIVVFRHPDLSGQFSLDGGGYLALPLVGDIAAHGLSTRQLEDEIELRLKSDRFLVSPQVGVHLATYRSFSILGEVGTPGGYEYRHGMMVINAIALAGGYTARADQSRARRSGVATAVSTRKPIRSSILATSSPLPSGTSDRSPAPARQRSDSDDRQELRHCG